MCFRNHLWAPGSGLQGVGGMVGWKVRHYPCPPRVFVSGNAERERDMVAVIVGHSMVTCVRSRQGR